MGSQCLPVLRGVELGLFGEKADLWGEHGLICLLEKLLEACYLHRVSNLLASMSGDRSQEFLLIVPYGRGAALLILVELAVVASRSEQLEEVQLQLPRVELPENLVYIVS